MPAEMMNSIRPRVNASMNVVMTCNPVIRFSPIRNTTSATYGPTTGKIPIPVTSNISRKYHNNDVANDQTGSTLLRRLTQCTTKLPSTSCAEKSNAKPMMNRTEVSMVLSVNMVGCINEKRDVPRGQAPRLLVSFN